MEALRKLLSAAQKPLMIVGGPGWTEQAAGYVRAFAVANDLPVIAGFRSQSIVDNRSDCYVGDLSLGCSAALKARVAEADLLLVAGDALSEVTTGRYALMAIPNPVQKLIHVFPGAEEIGRVFTPVLPIISNMPRFAEALSRLKPMNAEAWTEWRKSLREAYLNYQKPSAVTSELDLAKVMNCLNEVLPDNAVIANGAGNYTIWLHRFYRYRDFGTQLAPKSGCMGYGLPAAIAAKLRYPDRPVVVLAGDGCFVMSSQDFATAVRYGLKIVILVINNSCYGSIRMHQERHFPGRPSGTDLVNPDFAMLARSYGAFGEVVTRDADFAAAFQRALDAKGPALLELRVDPNRLTPEMRI
jgi:acetolactate synthase-1/2/3 large subunit